MTKEKQIENVISNMRNAKQQNLLEDIRDLLYVSNVYQGAIIQLMIEQPDNPMSRRYSIDKALGDAKKVIKSMDKRNEKSKKHIESLMAEYDAILRGGST